MARDYDAGRAKIDSLVETWKKDCLIESGSLLFDDRAIWTIPHLEDFRQRFLDNPLYGTEENFDQKLTTQLETASEDVRWLVDPSVSSSGNRGGGVRPVASSRFGCGEDWAQRVLSLRFGS